MWYVYLLRCVDGSTYTGITTDVEARFSVHKRGHGGRYTRSHPVQEIIAAVPIGSRAQASTLEYRAKRWSLKRRLEFFHRFSVDWRSYCIGSVVEAEGTIVMSRLQEALDIHTATAEQLCEAEMAVWQSVQQCVPTLANAILQTGVGDTGGARWVCFPIEEIGGSPAQCIARGEADHVLAYILRAVQCL